MRRRFSMRFLFPLVLLTACATPNAPPSVALLIGSEHAQGSGVVIADGWILTAAHVGEVSFAFGLAVTERIPHPILDLALIRVPGIIGATVVFGAEPALHDRLRAYGWWLGSQYQSTEGFAGWQLGEMSAPVIHGCSGGAVVNEAGELVGIIKSVMYGRTPMFGDGYALSNMAQFEPMTSEVIKWITDERNR